MFRAIRTILAVLIVPAALALASVSAQAQTVVKVLLIDSTSVGGPGGPGAAMGPGMMQGGAMTIRASASSVPAGKVSFEITNESRAFPHELIVIAVDDVNAPLPYDAKTARVPEDKVNVVGDSEEDLKPGTSKTLDVTLPAGKYLLVCNLAGHYKAGMVTPFTVTPVETPMD